LIKQYKVACNCAAFIETSKDVFIKLWSLSIISTTFNNASSGSNFTAQSPSCSLFSLIAERGSSNCTESCE